MIRLPETTYILNYENDQQAIVPGCKNLAQAIVRSCLPWKPNSASMLDGQQFIPCTAQAIDRAMAQIADARELIAA